MIISYKNNQEFEQPMYEYTTLGQVQEQTTTHGG